MPFHLQSSGERGLAQALQSTVSPDGRQIAFAVKEVRSFGGCTSAPSVNDRFPLMACKSVTVPDHASGVGGSSSGPRPGSSVSGICGTTSGGCRYGVSCGGEMTGVSGGDCGSITSGGGTSGWVAISISYTHNFRSSPRRNGDRRVEIISVSRHPFPSCKKPHHQRHLANKAQKAIGLQKLSKAKVDQVF